MAAYKDKNGKWYISVYYDDCQGKRSRKLKRGFATKREDLEWERDFLSKSGGEMDMTFESFLEIYKQDMRNRLKLNTWVMKESLINSKILPFFRGMRMSDIKPADIIAWQNGLMAYRNQDGNGY